MLLGPGAADAFEQVDGAARRAEVAEHQQAWRPVSGKQAGVFFAAGKLGWITVGGELVDQQPTEIGVGLDHEDRLTPSVRCWRHVGRHGVHGPRVGG